MAHAQSNGTVPWLETVNGPASPKILYPYAAVRVIVVDDGVGWGVHVLGLLQTAETQI